MKDRLQKFLNYEGLSRSNFAQIMGVQQSSITHILSGRNKPSFDFIEKMLQRFPKIAPDWLIMGKGPMYRTNESSSNPQSKQEILIHQPTIPQLENLNQDTSNIPQQTIPNSSANTTETLFNSFQTTSQESLIMPEPNHSSSISDSQSIISEHGKHPDINLTAQASGLTATNQSTGKRSENSDQHNQNLSSDQHTSQGNSKTFKNIDTKNNQSSSDIEKIIILFKNKTFITYTPEE